MDCCQVIKTTKKSLIIALTQVVPRYCICIILIYWYSARKKRIWFIFIWHANLMNQQVTKHQRGGSWGWAEGHSHSVHAVTGWQDRWRVSHTQLTPRGLEFISNVFTRLNHEVLMLKDNQIHWWLSLNICKVRQTTCIQITPAGD